MRIVFLAWHGSVHTRRWVRFFAERGHDVHVVTCGGGDVRDRDRDGAELARGYRVHDLGAPRMGRIGYLLKLRRARSLVRGLQPDVVHAHFVTSYGLLALATGVQPLVVTAHGDDVLIAPRNPVLRRIVTRVLRAAQLVTVPSEQMRDAVEALLGDAPARELVVFQYGVETRRLAIFGETMRASMRAADARRAAVTGSARRPVRIVSTRALLRLYRVDLVLDALALLRARGTAFTFDVVGDGPERAALERQAAALGIADAVSFHGAVDPYLVESFAAGGDAYVSVAASDGVSLALLEAMALGAVPVLSDIPANAEWVRDGVNGVLVTPDAAVIADGIERALQLDRESVARANEAIVGERADRETNLAACELLVDALCGVTWHADPVCDSRVA